MLRHNSQRGYFAYALYQKMKCNKRIYLICADLGYKVFNEHFKDFEDRCFNTGAAEQCALDLACGLALEGKIPFVYSITPFLLYRPFETIRTYINHEKIPVKLVASGRNKDYKHDGFSHDASDDRKFLFHFSNIKSYWPKTKEEIPNLVCQMVKDENAYYLNLNRE